MTPCDEDAVIQLAERIVRRRRARGRAGFEDKAAAAGAEGVDATVDEDASVVMLAVSGVCVLGVALVISLAMQTLVLRRALCGGPPPPRGPTGGLFLRA